MGNVKKRQRPSSNNQTWLRHYYSNGLVRTNPTPAGLDQRLRLAEVAVSGHQMFPRDLFVQFNP